MTVGHTAETAEPAEQFDERYVVDGNFITKPEVVFPTKILTKQNLGYLAQNIAETLLETSGALESYVMIKQMEELVNQLKELLHDKALLKAQGKGGTVNGAKYETRTKKTFEYDAPTLAKLDNDITAIKARMKLIRNTIEGGEKFVDTETGEVNTAKVVTIGQSLFITLPKE